MLIDLVKAVTSDTNEDFADKIAVSLDTFLATEAKITPDPPSYSFEEALERQVSAVGGTLKEESAKTLMVIGFKNTLQNVICERNYFYFSRRSEVVEGYPKTDGYFPVTSVSALRQSRELVMNNASLF